MQLSNSVDEIFFDFAGSLFRASRTKNIIRFHLATKLRSLSTSNNHYCNQNPELTLLSVQKWVYILIIFCCHILILSCGNNLIGLRCLTVATGHIVTNTSIDNALWNFVQKQFLTPVTLKQWAKISDVPAWLGLKATALAWLLTAWAFKTCRLGQSCQ